jgi:hypothetical protein
MSRGLHYVTPSRRKSSNPLRSVPLLRPAAEVLGASWYDGTWNQPKAEPVPVAAAAAVAPVVALDPTRELRAAEAGLREAVRVYDFARRGIGEANATSTAAVLKLGEVVIPAKPYRPERIRERRSYAFRQFNKRRAQLLAARRRLDAARTALGLPLAD